ncbi:hypothetical protein AXG93_3991s1010 [Marchantia polymorpha subsp. ruderalis]|uniref:Uncharacterized protein n=1 Tax=Marchantia polymorpha subsp. ruderalis TaxID=1480154 RepID=A0A176WEX1_MARPO|nr:hypothetical protein AXG93_3991s1010 [Marchantia polymorpha subsp. ruderalis]
MGRCAGDDGDLTFDSESVQVTRDEEQAYVDMFKHPRTGKNGFCIVWYRDRMRRNIAMALMQILRPSRPTYMMTWQVKFIKKAFGIELLTPVEIEAFPAQEVSREGEEVMLANELSSDLEGEPRNSS